MVMDYLGIEPVFVGYNGLVAVGNLIEKAGEIVAQFAMKLLDATKKAIQTVVEVVKEVVDAVVNWIKGRIIDGIRVLINELKNAADTISKGLTLSLKEMALDIANGNSENIGADVGEILKEEMPLVWAVTTGFVAFAAIEMALDTSSEGLLAVISDVLVGLLKSEIVRAIINVFLIADASVTALNKVEERTGSGITEGVIKNLLTAFDIGTAIVGEIWTIYKVFEERASKEKFLFYLGLGLAVVSTIATMDGDTLDLHGAGLEAYDWIVTGLGAAGLGFMYFGSRESIENKLPWTGLLEWIVGWAGLMSALIKLGADWHAGFK